jgi:serine/threonine-protein kinase
MIARLEWLPEAGEEPSEPSSGVQPTGDASLIDGRYRIVDHLGVGGMGVVYHAEDIWLGRAVAIKLLQPATQHDEEILDDFKKEARVLAQVRHDNVVQVYAFGPHRGSFYLAMEHVAGQNLDTIIEEHASRSSLVDRERALSIIRQVARGLSAIHARQIVHRDVKPSNIVIEEATGRPVLIDFGMARRRSISDPKLSSIGGTPHYMAPEQATDTTGTGVTPRSDLYALACTAFELLTGRPVFSGEGAMELVSAHLHQSAPRISSLRPELAPLDPVFLRALAKSPDNRQRDCLEFVEQLDKAALKIGAAVPPSAPAAALAHRLRMVIWERDEVFRRQVVRVADATLRASGDAVEIECVATAEEFIEGVERDPPHIVIVDDESAAGAAECAIAALRAVPATADVEVVVLNRDCNADSRRLIPLRACELPKPVNQHVLRAVLAKLGARVAERRQRESLVAGSIHEARG